VVEGDRQNHEDAFGEGQVQSIDKRLRKRLYNRLPFLQPVVAFAFMGDLARKLPTTARPPATMADVAARAGVSVSTVSHVVNGTRPVNPPTRERVKRAIAETGYLPNRVARSLATRDTQLIGIVMSALTNRFFVPVVAAIDRAGRRHGYNCVLADSRDEVSYEAEALNTLLSRRVNGVVLAPAAGDRRPVLDRLLAEGVPTVLVDRFADDRFDQVGVENVEATASLVEHLASLGHTRIALVSGLRGLSTTDERVAGYQLGLERAGLVASRELVVSGKSAAGAAEHAVNELLDRQRPPTAIVSGNNYMTIGVLRALRARGARVPDDIAVAAFDDIEFADVFQPRLTVIAQPLEQIATTAVDLLIKRMSGRGSRRGPQRIQLSGTFVHRESCGCTLRQPSKDHPLSPEDRRNNRPSTRVAQLAK
jgi:LacI family transcriptional regulator